VTSSRSVAGTPRQGVASGRLRQGDGTEHAATASATPLMRASTALVDAWLTGSADSARRAAGLAAAIPAPFWEPRARSAGRSASAT